MHTGRLNVDQRGALSARDRMYGTLPHMDGIGRVTTGTLYGSQPTLCIDQSGKGRYTGALPPEASTKEALLEQGLGLGPRFAYDVNALVRNEEKLDFYIIVLFEGHKAEQSREHTRCAYRLHPARYSQNSTAPLRGSLVVRLRTLHVHLVAGAEDIHY